MSELDDLKALVNRFELDLIEARKRAEEATGHVEALRRLDTSRRVTWPDGKGGELDITWENLQKITQKNLEKTEGKLERLEEAVYAWITSQDHETLKKWMIEYDDEEYGGTILIEDPSEEEDA